MDKLINSISDLATKLHPDRVEQLAREIENAGSPDKLRARLDPSSETLMRDLIEDWRRTGVSAASAALALRVAGTTAHLLASRQDIDLVWTGPNTALVPVRHTEQVLLDVISSAREDLFLVSFVAYDVESVMKALEKAVSRGVTVSLLLESSAEHGGTVSVDSIGKMRNRIPGAYIYRWKSQGSGMQGAVHAKCAAADGESAFVTSANLSDAAMERNIELGIRVKGGHLPMQLSDLLHYLVKTKVIEEA